jgi:carbon-monoxide dehydrogenase small subunit
MSRHRIFITVNGERHELEVEANRRLIDVLNEDLGLTGTHKGCERGDCGLCTVLQNGKPVKSCMVLAVEVDGQEITTIEGISKGEELSPVQRAFVEHGALQCGFCTPAFVVTATALLRRNRSPTEEEVREAVEGILCRCTGYRQIIDAILDAARGAKG